MHTYRIATVITEFITCSSREIWYDGIIIVIKDTLLSYHVSYVYKYDSIRFTHYELHSTDKSQRSLSSYNCVFIKQSSVQNHPRYFPPRKCKVFVRIFIQKFHIIFKIDYLASQASQMPPM